VPRQGSQGSNVRVIFVFSLTLEAVSLTFEPYLKMQKKQIFSLTLEPFSKTSLTLEVGESFSLTLEPDSCLYYSFLILVSRGTYAPCGRSWYKLTN